MRERRVLTEEDFGPQGFGFDPDFDPRLANDARRRRMQDDVNFRERMDRDMRGDGK